MNIAMSRVELEQRIRVQVKLLLFDQERNKSFLIVFLEGRAPERLEIPTEPIAHKNKQ